LTKRDFNRKMKTDLLKTNKMIVFYIADEFLFVGEFGEKR